MSETSESAQTPSAESGQIQETATDAAPVVVFRNVSIAFDGPPVLEDISFSVAPAETRILLGPAGVG
jgi:phospholipid/cholesterol/gamma-HCH transport system ATP-binding protein